MKRRRKILYLSKFLSHFPLTSSKKGEKKNKNVTMRPLNGWNVNQECDREGNCTKESFRIEEVLIGHWLLPNVFGKTI